MNIGKSQPEPIWLACLPVCLQCLQPLHCSTFSRSFCLFFLLFFLFIFWLRKPSIHIFSVCLALALVSAFSATLGHIHLGGSAFLPQSPCGPWPCFQSSAPIYFTAN
jgi:hypothetical protein